MSYWLIELVILSSLNWMCLDRFREQDDGGQTSALLNPANLYCDVSSVCVCERDREHHTSKSAHLLGTALLKTDISDFENHVVL